MTLVRSLDDLHIDPFYILPKQLSEFMLNCLSRFESSSLLQSQCRARNSSDELLERKFQMDFYWIAPSLLLSHLKIDPDVGHNFGEDFAVDFKVNGKHNWAIEFLVESSCVGEHLQRFKPGWKYYDALPFFQHIVVNFVSYACTDTNDMSAIIQERDKSSTSLHKTEPHYMRV
mmetsp:Transcript_21410/g.31000  ORF Transcript_21410/g.31000 Transcript_21410/m.31000 type:complete len:173 (+) Transcript_21410:1035-1553(+)